MVIYLRPFLTIANVLKFCFFFIMLNKCSSFCKLTTTYIIILRRPGHLISALKEHFSIYFESHNLQTCFRPVVLNVGSMAAHQVVINIFCGPLYIYEYLFSKVQTLNWDKINLLIAILLFLDAFVANKVDFFNHFFIFMYKIIIFSKIKNLAAH